MRLERRIREEGERLTGALDPDIERSFSTVVLAVRRRRRIRWTLSMVFAIPVVASVVFLTPDMLDALRPARLPPVASQPTEVTVPTPAPAPDAETTFARVIVPGLAVVRANGLEGRWSIAVDGQGRMRLLTPEAFAGAASSWPLGRVADELHTSAFSGDLCTGLEPGTYRWARVTHYLILDVISDRCDARVWLLTSGPWKSRSSR